jgi:hypothetical protein
MLKLYQYVLFCLFQESKYQFLPITLFIIHNINKIKKFHQMGPIHQEYVLNSEKIHVFFGNVYMVK